MNQRKRVVLFIVCMFLMLGAFILAGWEMYRGQLVFSAGSIVTACGLYFLGHFVESTPDEKEYKRRIKKQRKQLKILRARSMTLRR